jgi:hypothetical protein
MFEKQSVYIFGNSPSCNLNYQVNCSDKIVALGQGICHIKRPKIDIWFTRAAQYSSELAVLADNVIVLSAKEDNQFNNTLFFTDHKAKRFIKDYKLDLRPSLGLFAVLWLKQFYKNVYISGITLKINDPNIKGYFWSKTERRFNSFHNLPVECLFLNKMIIEGTLHEF